MSVTARAESGYLARIYGVFVVLGNRPAGRRDRLSEPLDAVDAGAPADHDPEPESGACTTEWPECRNEHGQDAQGRDSPS